MTIIAFAQYFLSLADEEAGDAISNLKLQKLAYYAQGFSLALFGEPLFAERIEAWTHGPVVPDLYRAYKQYENGAIPRPEDFDPQSIDKKTRDLLDEVYNVYGQYSAWKLRNMTHNEAPWVDAYAKGGGTLIQPEAMRAFFQTLTNIDPPKPGGKDFERLVEGKAISKHLGAGVLEKIHQPVEFKWIYPGAKQNAVSIKGYPADLLIDVCNAILAANAVADVEGICKPSNEGGHDDSR